MEQLRDLLEEIYLYFSNIPIEEEAQAEIASLQSMLPNDDVDLSELRGQVATGLSDWLIGYLKLTNLSSIFIASIHRTLPISSRLTPLEESPLWDIWYTGLTPFPSEVRVPNLILNLTLKALFIAAKSIRKSLYLKWSTSTP